MTECLLMSSKVIFHRKDKLEGFMTKLAEISEKKLSSAYKILQSNIHFLMHVIRPISFNSLCVTRATISVVRGCNSVMPEIRAESCIRNNLLRRLDSLDVCLGSVMCSLL